METVLVATLVAASVSGVFLGEVDHIWLFFMPLLVAPAGSALEVVWGLLPAWLGVEKWFTNGLHRVRKHFATYQREDDPPVMASYINRYHRGRLVVDWHDDYLHLAAWRPELGDLRQVLPAAYFQAS